MDKKQILIELEKNIKDFKSIEEKNFMIMLAIYQKTTEEIRNKKLKELDEYFSNQVNYYEQNIADYQDEINLIKKEYNNQIDELIEAYDYLYINTYKTMQQAINNQVVAIANTVTLWDKNEQKSDEKINKKMMAVIQKKVNYSVIVEECKARLNWCIENIETDMNSIFENKFYQMEIYKNRFFENIKRKILNLISGKKKLAEVIEKYNQNNLKEITDNNYFKKIGIIATAQGVLKQIQNVERQINTQYEEAIQNS